MGCLACTPIHLLAQFAPAPSDSSKQADPSKNINKMGKINSTDLIKGAAALLIMAAALWVMAKALQEFNTVDPSSLLTAAGALVILGAAMWGLSILATGPLGAGLLGATLAMIGFGFAILMVGAGIKLLGEGIGSVAASLPAVIDAMASAAMINFLPILGLAFAFGELALALAAVGLAGALALPVLNGLNALGIIGTTTTAPTNSNTILLDEIKSLHKDLTDGKIAVYIDGKKVTAAVNTVVKNTSGNNLTHGAKPGQS